MTTAFGQKQSFRYCCHSPEPACLPHTDFSPRRTIIAYAGSLSESLLNESTSYVELPCITVINMRTVGSFEPLLGHLHMAQNFFDRLRSYYIKVAEVLRGEADAASVFANTTDIGMSRELAYAEFLKQHAPSKCNVFLGGFLFDENGTESKQLDIIITTDTAPRFNFHNKDGSGKSFSPIEGTLGVVSIKSTLNRTELFDALGGIASIPPTRALDGRVNILLKIKNYDDWPVKIVYASKGIAPGTLLAHINEYYDAHPEIPLSRRPNFIHVAGSCLIVRVQDDMALRDRGTGVAEPLALGTYHLLTTDSDLQAIVWTLRQLQQNATASTHILFSYDYLINKVCS